eukprot:GFYU01010810.1.p1 GENE.GFYU01010810.1~~GFYU01010810.1.p1  ORF type:complete len:355 (+),score=80.79 GFYU01010810.1:127-1065(+)
MSGDEAKIVVVGSSNVDLISYVKALPKLGETIHGSKFVYGFGGKGANQAVMAGKLSSKQGNVTMVTKVGTDVFGQDTLKNYEKCNISLGHVSQTDQAASGMASISVDEDGHNCIIVVAGANNCMTTDEVEKARPAIREAKVVITQNEVPLDVTLAALKIGREEGAITIFNPAPAPADLSDEFYKYSDYVCPNETECEVLTGQPVSTDEQVEAAAMELLNRGAKNVIITLGERGTLLVTPNGKTRVPAEVVKAVDTVGAGDSFLGSFAYFLANGKTPEEAIKRANHVASISVQGHGTQTSFPDRASLKAELFE